MRQIMSQVKLLLKVNPERLGNYDFLVGVKNSPSVRSVKPFDIAVPLLSKVSF